MTDRGEGRPPPGTIRICVPRRADGGWRDRLWAFTRPKWAELGLPIVEGASPDGPFNRSAACNDAARGEWDVAVFIDADVLIEPPQVWQGIEQAQTGPTVLAFTRYVGLNRAITERILDGMAGPNPEWDLHSRFRSAHHESSVVVVPRAAFDEVGGFDERFVGWGQEDVAFAQAIRVMVGPLQRIIGPVWHLWHARSPDRNPFLGTYEASQVLGKRYREATDVDAMRALLDERRVDAGPSR